MRNILLGKKSKNKKAFQVENIFMFILALMIMAFILFYSYRSINSLMSKKDTADLSLFRTDLDKETSSMARSPGNVDYPVFTLPSYVTSVCFTNLDSVPTDINNCVSANKNKGFDKFMCDAWQSGFNIFLLPKKEQFSFKNELIQLNDNVDVLCVAAKGATLELKMTGKGKKVLIEQAS